MSDVLPEVVALNASDDRAMAGVSHQHDTSDPMRLAGEKHGGGRKSATFHPVRKTEKAGRMRPAPSILRNP
jgi:hypothetical protein